MSNPTEPPTTSTGKGPFDGLAKPSRRKRPQRAASPPVTVEDERLRQERETFDQRKFEAIAWSRLRLTMGWTALVLLVALSAASIFVLLSHKTFPAVATSAAASTVLVQTLALVAAVWRLVIGSGPSQLAPVTRNTSIRPEQDETHLPTERN
jgi:uncharacterized membrane protein YqjE